MAGGVSVCAASPHLCALLRLHIQVFEELEGDSLEGVIGPLGEPEGGEERICVCRREGGARGLIGDMISQPPPHSRATSPPPQLSFPPSPYQSMVQQLTSDGNWRNRSLKALPMGLKHRTTCRFCAQ